MAAPEEMVLQTKLRFKSVTSFFEKAGLQFSCGLPAVGENHFLLCFGSIGPSRSPSYHGGAFPKPVLLSSEVSRGGLLQSPDHDGELHASMCWWCYRRIFNDG